MLQQLSIRSLFVLLPLAAVVSMWQAYGEDAQPAAAEKAETAAEAKAEEAPAYPVLNDLKLMEELTIAGVKMMEAGEGKGSKELNGGLECRQSHLKLAPVSKQAISDEDLYARACESVFVICGLYQLPDSEEWDAAFATAFVVSPDGVLTTSRHFFDDPQPCEIFLVSDAKGKIYPVTEILCSDDKLDSCLFRIPAEGLKPLPIGEKSPVPGSRVRIVSHPGYFFYFFSSGQVANYYKDDQDLRWMNVTADFGQGSSGAPAFDDCGNVVGQVASTLTLYAMGSVLEEPIISRRKVTRLDDGRFSVGPIHCAAPVEKKKETPEEGDAPPKKKKKKKKEDEPKELPPPVEEIADPQMVFKTCTPLESIRGMIKH